MSVAAEREQIINVLFFFNFNCSRIGIRSMHDLYVMAFIISITCIITTHFEGNVNFAPNFTIWKRTWQDAIFILMRSKCIYRMISAPPLFSPQLSLGIFIAYLLRTLSTMTMQCLFVDLDKNLYPKFCWFYV